MRTPTIKDVARASGVSTATVSQALGNGGRPVHPQTRERVLQAARALDYRPNAVARGLVRKRMNTIGLVFTHGNTPAQSNPFLMMLLDGVLSVSTRRNQSTMLSTVPNWERAAEHLPELTDGRCDGVLLLVPPADCPLFETLRNRKMPFVLVNGRDQTGYIPCVDVDNVGAATRMTDCLLQMGHRRIAFVHQRGEEMFLFTRERQEGYRQAMTARGLHDPSLAGLTWEQALALDWAASERPTALFCSYDALAIPLMEDLRKQGLRVPEDVSVVGFDDIPDAAGCRPALTTMRQPMTQLGERAAEMLLAAIDGSDAPAEQELLPTELVLRASAVPPPVRGQN